MNRCWLTIRCLCYIVLRFHDWTQKFSKIHLKRHSTRKMERDVGFFILSEVFTARQTLSHTPTVDGTRRDVFLGSPHFVEMHYVSFPVFITDQLNKRKKRLKHKCMRLSAALILDQFHDELISRSVLGRVSVLSIPYALPVYCNGVMNCVELIERRQRKVQYPLFRFYFLNSPF